MLLARPTRAFSLRGKSVLACHVPEENPNAFLGKVLWFHPSYGESKRIRIEGISTATDARAHEFDFHYSGDEIGPDEIMEGSLLADGPLDVARREIDLMAK